MPFSCRSELGQTRVGSPALLRFERSFCLTGFPLTVAAAIRARKAWERVLCEIEETGQVVFRRRRGKRVGVRLSDGGDWRLRRRCCLSDWPEAATVLLCIDAHENQGPSGNSVAETFLIGSDYDGTPLFRDRLLSLEEVLAPALCRCWVNAWSDCEGRTAYSLTHAGRAVLRGELRPPAIDWPEWDRAASDIYSVELTAARRVLESIRGTESHCPIPLSAGAWPEDSEAAEIPPVFLKGSDRVRSWQNMRAAIRKVGVATPEHHKDSR